MANEKKNINLEIETPSYNEKRYGKPWITLSEFNQKMDDALDRVLSMPQETPIQRLARWQARENLLIADLYIGPEMLAQEDEKR